MNISSNRPGLNHITETAVHYFVVAVEVFLALRIFFEFFFTSASGSFFHWIMATTQPALEPFRSLYPAASTTSPSTNWYIDWVALFAMAAYALVFYLVFSFARWLAGRK